MFSFEYLIKYVLTLADIPVWTLRFHSGTCSNLENWSWSGSWKISSCKILMKMENLNHFMPQSSLVAPFWSPQWIEWICYYTVIHQGVSRHEQFGRADTSYSYTRQVISHKLLLDARQGKHVPLPLLCTKITILNNNTKQCLNVQNDPTLNPKNKHAEAWPTIKPNNCEPSIPVCVAQSAIMSRISNSVIHKLLRCTASHYEQNKIQCIAIHRIHRI